MQKHIAGMGMPVWGGRRADELEVKKILFRSIQRQLGMNTPEYDVVIGLDDLRKFCDKPENEDCWIKLSPQFRGNRETFHHKDRLTSREILDDMGVQFGIVQDVLKFIAERTIDAPFESGLDSYCVDGAHPKTALQAYERKDRCCFGAVQPYSEMPQQLTQIGDQIFALLRERGARQFCSTEVKITEAGKAYLLEPTIRMASPAGEPQLELYDNFSEIIYEGAHGRLVEPELAGKFYAQVMMEHCGEDNRWRSIQIPEEVRRWVKVYSCCQIGDRLGIAPGERIIGSVLGIGSTPREALDHVKENAEALKDEPVSLHVEDLSDTLMQIEEAEEAGIPFTTQMMPEPEEVLPS
jgi:hypothetical protein